MKTLRKAAVVFACAISAVGPAMADGEAEKPAEASDIQLEKEDPEILTAWLNADFMSAYVWRNAVCNDDLVLQPSVGADLTRFDPFWLGFSVWQGYDLTHRRGEILTHGLTETDYNVHLGATAWENDEGDTSLSFEIAHEWYDMNFVRDGQGGACPDTREIYVLSRFVNPVVTVYGQVSWRYLDFGDYKSGVHYEIGFNREVELCDSLVAGADWNVNFGDGHYLQTLYGTTLSGRDAAGDRVYNDTAFGFGGTTVKVYLTWEVTEWFSLTGLVAYTGVLNGAYREAMGEKGDGFGMCGVPGEPYPRDFIWGGVTAKFSF